MIMASTQRCCLEGRRSQGRGEVDVAICIWYVLNVLLERTNSSNLSLVLVFAGGGGSHDVPRRGLRSFSQRTWQGF